jgi:hypothetical protein
MSATVEASLRPGDQARGWKRRWTETERDLAELLARRAAADRQISSTARQCGPMLGFTRSRAGVTGFDADLCIYSSSGFSQ